jgi:hypothetical protein
MTSLIRSPLEKTAQAALDLYLDLARDQQPPRSLTVDLQFGRQARLQLNQRNPPW